MWSCQEPNLAKVLLPILFHDTFALPRIFAFYHIISALRIHSCCYKTIPSCQSSLLHTVTACKTVYLYRPTSVDFCWNTSMSEKPCGQLCDTDPEDTTPVRCACHDGYQLDETGVTCVG